jgi:putative two-component system response regulator
MEGVEKRQTVLVVDDTLENIDVLKGILREYYKVIFATSGEMALKVVSKTPPDIVLLDIMMPGMDGFEVCRRLKEDPRTKNIPVMFVTAKDQDVDEAKGFELGAVDYITKPVSAMIVRARVKTHLALSNQTIELERLVREKTRELNETRLEIIKKLGLAAEYKDNETGRHVIRMSKYCYYIAKEYGLSEKDAELLLQVAPMHDIGKIGISDDILQKPGRLDEGEREIINTHPTLGFNIMKGSRSDLLQMAATVAAEHHEKWNGEGYPNKLKGEEINIFARIAAISDVFDALVSRRPYKEAWDVEKTVDYIKSESGKQFDPDVVDAFVKALNKIVEVKNEFED